MVRISLHQWSFYQTTEANVRNVNSNFSSFWKKNIVNKKEFKKKIIFLAFIVIQQVDVEK